ncbi:phosphatidylethanolamine-binding protein [Aphelenchoides avenae]|nr:phosphatidylethanolamine-binding protein [Aphelenchus avenae]
MKRVIVLAILLTIPHALLTLADDSRTAQAFRRWKIVPDIIPSPPQGAMYARFFASGVQVNLGNALSPSKLQDAPGVDYDGDGFYTFMMVDPDAPSPTDPTARCWVHWLIYNVPMSVVNEGAVIQAYNPPTPPPGSGYHRYVLMAFEQSAGWIRQKPSYSGISGFNVTDFAKQNGLKMPPVAGNFFQAKAD